ncbi:hypothetical protein [Paraburkholderia sp. BCC1885]|uniref:hypothetical protein n=1 Tax=Paraburkholderia sp. BCC1885 TaxID=2562669 RepID=UPI0011829B7D|nr:hypothetical protein [Paraburkholderia sp. BCC1885]
MSDLLTTPEAKEWIKSATERYAGGIFGQLKPAVIWSDARGPDGRLLVAADPAVLAGRINSIPHMVLHNHDPGKPKGKILEAKPFVSISGDRFVVAILGFYAGGEVLGFADVGLDINEEGIAPRHLQALPPDVRIELAVDPREVDALWLDTVVSSAPVKLKRTHLSHNAAESASELIRIGLPYIAILWNPFVTSIASEASKATYTAIREWVRGCAEKLEDRRAPILDIHSFYGDCQVTFLLRGKDVAQHYAAHDKLSEAAARAAQMVGRLKDRGQPARQLVYEFDKEATLWYPSYVILDDDRIVTDSTQLIAIESLPNGLSLGLSQDEQLEPIATLPPETGAT